MTPAVFPEAIRDHGDVPGRDLKICAQVPETLRLVPEDCPPRRAYASHLRHAVDRAPVKGPPRIGVHDGSCSSIGSTRRPAKDWEQRRWRRPARSAGRPLQPFHPWPARRPSSTSRTRCPEPRRVDAVLQVVVLTQRLTRSLCGLRAGIMATPSPPRAGRAPNRSHPRR